MKHRIILTMLLLAGVFTQCGVLAQTVKDIVDDRSGKYLYAQTRDKDESLAQKGALEELATKVEDYVSSNGLAEYDKGWRDRVKRIVSEKFGMYRVFLYLTVDDLKPSATGTVPPPVVEKKEEVVGTPSILEKKEPEKTERSKAVNQEMEKQEETNRETENSTDKVEMLPYNEPMDSDEDFEPEEEASMPSAGAGTLPDGIAGDLIRMILESDNVAQVGNVMAKGKNMRAISIYGNSDSKYVGKAYIVTSRGGKFYVFSPSRDGKRMVYSSGSAESVEDISGKMVYWFLMKN